MLAQPGKCGYNTRPFTPAQGSTMEDDEIKVLRMVDILKMTKLSRTTLWRRVRRGDFPAPMRLGAPPARAKGWLLTDVVEWVNGQTWSPKPPTHTIH